MMDQSCPHHMELHGSVTVGTKWQIVIPKEVRAQLGIEVGDKLIVITKDDIAVGLIKSENMKDILSHLQQELGEE